MIDAIVIGGGVSGLTAAWRLKSRGADVLLVEAQDVVGGHIRTIAQDGCLLESGPHSFMGSSETIFRIIREMNWEPSLEPAATAAANRYIFRKDRLHALPMSIISFLSTRLLSPTGKLRLMAEPLIPNGAGDFDTAMEYFIRRFGKEAATFIMGPFISGVYAGDPEQLGARAAFPKFWRFEKDHGSMIIGAFFYMRAKKKRLKQENAAVQKGLFSFRSGLGRLTQNLARELHRGIRTGMRVRRVLRKENYWTVQSDKREINARAVISAVPPHCAADILKQTFPQVVRPLQSIPMAPVAMIHWTYPRNPRVIPPGFGFLMPRIYHFRVLGTLFPSYLFSNRAPEDTTLLASFYGGMTDPEAAKLDDPELIHLLKTEHEQILGLDGGKVRILKILRYPHAIPQLLPGHPEVIDSFEKQLRTAPGIFPAGNYLTGVGVEHAVSAGFRAAEKCLVYLETIRDAGKMEVA